MKFVFTIFSILLVLNVISQDETGECFTIDFEDLEALGFRELDLVSDQYLEEFGVRFELESGGFPILAKVGSPTVAFGSNYGDDRCAPSEDVGEYFLTDDGSLDGLSSETIVIYFEVPVNRVEGCIMDMDFDEEFYLEARDITGNLIASINVSAGDPGTGDGLSTCWTLLPVDCNTTIYSITMEGERNISGAFGLGLDNLRFCYQGYDLREDNLVSVTPLTCGQQNGTIQINNTSDQIYTYSFNGAPFSEQTIFENIESGFHQISVVNEEGCLADIFVFVNDIPIYELDYLSVDTRCALDNGIINVSPNFFSLVTSLQISLNGEEFIENESFLNMPAGTYQIGVVDENGCNYSETLTIDESEMPLIDSVQMRKPIICNQTSGTFNVFASGGLGTLQYSLDKINYTENSEFTIDEAGLYTVYLKDEDDCESDKDITINSSPNIEVNIETRNTKCLEQNGSIRVTAQGGVGELNFEWDHNNAVKEDNLTNLDYGNYQLTISDELGCVELREAIIESDNCPIYAPNIFNPSLANDKFRLGFKENYDATIGRYCIYNRWGNLIFINENFSLDCEDCWWDGKLNGEYLNAGVFAYHVQIIHPDNTEELLIGNVTLIR